MTVIDNKCSKCGELKDEEIRRKPRQNGIIQLVCRRCQKMTMRAHRLANKERIYAHIKEDRKKNPEKYRRMERNKVAKNRNLYQELPLLRMYKISREQYRQMFIDQNNKCKICELEETRKSRTTGETCRLTLDHCHETGKVRGLLCHRCNVGIGGLRHDSQLMLKAIEYLKQ